MVATGTGLAPYVSMMRSSLAEETSDVLSSYTEPAIHGSLDMRRR